MKHPTMVSSHEENRNSAYGNDLCSAASSAALRMKLDSTLTLIEALQYPDDCLWLRMIWKQKYFQTAGLDWSAYDAPIRIIQVWPLASVKAPAGTFEAGMAWPAAWRMG